MLVTFQFPIGDGRPFAPGMHLRLPLPDWPDPYTAINPQFVHHFGNAVERIAEPDEAWPDEIKYCRARRGLRFDRLETRHAGLPNRRFRPRCAFRRLFSDGQAVARVEIGVAHTEQVYPLEELDIKEILAIARETAEIPTIVPNLNGAAKPRPILAQGKYLARLYAHASMNSAGAERSLALGLVEAASPLILVELEPYEASLDVEAPMAKGLVAVDRESVNGAKALFCQLRTQAGIVSTWILQRGTATAGQLRSLRICLTRLHAEREVLDLTLKQIHRRRLLNPPSEEAVNLLDSYFNERIKIVNRCSWGGMKQSEILAAFDATQVVVRPASQAQLISRYEGSRRQVWEKISIYQEQRRATRLVQVVNVDKGAIMAEKNVNIKPGPGSIINVADYMNNVTNTINNNLEDSDASDEVKTLIKQLTEEIKRVTEADPIQAKEMGNNLKVLSESVASGGPEQKRWYEFSLEGIKKAAQAVGEIAEPILSIVGKLSALLLA